MNALTRIHANVIAFDRLVEQTPTYQAIGGVNACLNLVRSAVDQAVEAPGQDSFDASMDLALRAARQTVTAAQQMVAELERKAGQ